jgi:hypothetical protein
MRLLNKNTARRVAAATALLTMTAAMSVGAFAADAEDATVAGYLPPQSSEVMVQGDIALHSDVPVGEVDPNYGGYASPVENPIQGNVMMISDETPLPSDTPVEKSEARYTVKGLLGKQVLYTARQEGRVLTLDVPDDNATFRTTILDMQTLMNQGVSTLVLKTDKTSTTLNLTLLCQDQKPGTTSAAALTSPWASAAAATSSLAADAPSPAFCLYHSCIAKDAAPAGTASFFSSKCQKTQTASCDTCQKYADLRNSIANMGGGV